VLGCPQLKLAWVEPYRDFKATARLLGLRGCDKNAIAASVSSTAAPAPPGTEAGLASPVRCRLLAARVGHAAGTLPAVSVHWAMEEGDPGLSRTVCVASYLARFLAFGGRP